MSVGAAHQPLREAVLQAIRDAIISGRFAQGERLIEEDIASRLEVSRNPIRSALQMLSVEGFVELEPRRGARVAQLGRERARELFELRGPLEGLVAKLAAERRTGEDVARLREVVDRGQRAGASGQLDVLPALNTEFHGALANAAGNGLLASTLHRLSDQIRWAYASHVARRWERSWREHAAIVDAVADQDLTRAEREGAEHIANAAAAYLD